MDSIISQCLKYVQSIKRFKMTVITVALIFSLIKHLVQNEEKSQSDLVFSLNKKPSYSSQKTCFIIQYVGKFH